MHGDGSEQGGATCAPARRAMPAVCIMFVFATCLGSAAAEAQCVVSDCRTAHPPTPAARGGAFWQLKNRLTGKGWGAHGGAEPRILRRVNSHPIIRVKSYGELSSVEYDELINKLFDATRKGDLNTCFELVKAGAWPNHERLGDPLQTNAVQLAAVHGHDQLIELLVHLGADINLRNNQGMTALHMAAQLGGLKVVKTLVALGADPMATDWMQETPEMKALLAREGKVADFLRKVVVDERDSMLAFKALSRRDLEPHLGVDHAHDTRIHNTPPTMPAMPQAGTQGVYSTVC